MSAGRDPFDELSRHRDPDADPAIMQATIAQSVAAFRARPAHVVPHGGIRAWLHNRLPSAGWRAPVGVGAFAVVAMLVALPVALRTTPPETVTDMEAAPSPDAPSTQAERGAGATRSMGLRPPPERSRALAPAQEPALAPTPAPAPPPEGPGSVFEGRDVRVGSRLIPSALELFLPDISGERAIDNLALVPGAQAQVLSAFRLPERGLVAISLRVDRARFWIAYRLVDGAYVRDAASTARIGDAPDDAEAQRRLVAD